VKLPEIELSMDTAAIRANRDKLRAAMEKVKAEEAGIRALMNANQSMCKHPSKTTYTDRGGCWSWDCDTCGGAG
jgi:hypothetical protein